MSNPRHVRVQQWLSLPLAERIRLVEAVGRPAPKPAKTALPKCSCGSLGYWVDSYDVARCNGCWAPLNATAPHPKARR